jgi:hypothetical protein
MPKINDFDPSSILTDEEKEQIVSQRAKQWAVEAYSHQLNREAILATDPKADTSDIDAALATLSTAVENAVSKGDEIQAAREAVE